ncbi:MAG: glycosyltransferase family 4 protein [Chlamydiales bacterium]|nr:glycosyltransferase family 4 protein [Chlamydiales bacterium]
MSYQHVLNLDTLGGVEELFIHFLTHAKQLSRIKQHVLVTSNQPHPFFVSALKSADSVVVEKYIGPCKVPKFIRKFTRVRALKGADTTVLWNRMESYPWPGKVIYYEHGASWIAQKADGFFDSVDAILANSHAASRVLQLKWGIQTPITVITNPLKPTILRASTAKKAPQKMRLGYIGRLIPLKGVCLLLHAIKGLDVTLTIAGCGPEKEHLVELAKKLDVPVTFLGAIKDVSGFYDSIDALIVPSIREPLGLVAQEAALRGCPVICSKVDGLPEVVQDTKTGFCIEPTLPLSMYSELGGRNQNMPDLVYNPTTDTLTTPKLLSPQDIASKITALIQNPELYESMSQNAIEFASQRPNFLQYTQSLLNNL